MQKEVHFLNIRVNYSTLVSVSGAPERPRKTSGGMQYFRRYAEAVMPDK